MKPPLSMAGPAGTAPILYAQNASRQLFTIPDERDHTDAQQWTSNIRFNIIHRPLSDFFLVDNDRRDSVTRAFTDRALVAKTTCLFAF
jgi:hypothetical protein